MVDKLDQMMQMLKEIQEEKKKPKKGDSVNEDEIVKRVYEKVMDKIGKDGICNKISLLPAKYVLEKFQEKEINRWEKKLGELDHDHIKIGAFVIALGKATNRTEIITKVFGSNNATGAGYMKHAPKIDDLINLLVLRVDKQKRIYSNVSETIEENLKTYEPSQEKIRDTTDRILRIFIGKMEDEPDEE